MNVNFLKKVPIAVAAALVSASAFAALDMDSRRQDVGIETELGTYGARTASGQPALVDKPDGHWYVNADVIYWHAKLGGTEYAYTDSDSNGPASTNIKGDLKVVDFNWDWGFKLGVGYVMDHDDWDIHLEYTYYRTYDSEGTQAGTNSVIVPNSIYPFFDSGFITNTVNKATSEYDFDFDNIDLELGRAYFVSRKLDVRPHFGLRTTWLDLENIVRYSGGDIDPHTLTVKDTSDCWGLGPRMGLDSHWFLGHGFFLFGDIAGSLLFSKFDVDHKEKYTADDSFVRISANRHAFVPNAQLALGLGYGAYVNDNKQHIDIRLGFEAQYYWRVNQMIYVGDTDASAVGTAQTTTFDRYSEDASMHGVTLEARWDF